MLAAVPAALAEAPPMVALEQVSYSRRPHFWRAPRPLLRGVCCRVPVGAAFGLLGPNGAGKTTTIKVVLGLVRPQQGRATVAGAVAGSLVARRHIGFVPERPELPGYTDARTYVRQHGLWAGLGFRAARAAADAALARVRLGGVTGPMARFSKGMAQRASLAQALVGAPRLLVLDEPSSGLDPDGRTELRQILAGLHAAGTTLLICTHALADAAALCGHLAILVGGAVRLAGALPALLEAACGPLDVEAADVGPEALAAAAPLARAQDLGDRRYRFAAADLAAANAVVDRLRFRGATLRALAPQVPPMERLYARAMAGT